MLTFDDVGHVYRFDGVVVPSVTQIIRRLFDLKFISAAMLEAAGERGDDVHTACFLDDMGDLAEETITDEIKGYLAGWRKFREECKPQWIEMETMAYHPVYKFAGRRDRVGHLFGMMTMGDIKSGVPSPTTGIQLAAYSLVWDLEHPENPIKRHVAIHLTRQGNYKVIPYESLSHVRAFLSLVTLENWAKEHGRD